MKSLVLAAALGLMGSAGETERVGDCEKFLLNDKENVMVYLPDVGIYFPSVEGFKKAKGWL